MHQNTEAGVAALERLKTVQPEVIDWIIRARQAITRNELQVEQLVDMAYLLKQLMAQAEHIRLEASKLSTLVDKVACAIYVTRYAADPEAPKDLTGEVAKGTPQVGQGAQLPDRKTPAYATLMTYLGMTQQQLEEGVLRPHWPSVCAHLDRLAEQGKPLPPGLSSEQVYTRYHLVNLAPRKGVSKGA